jgi:uncharacterized membrane protein YkvA (DUF1232 family)
VDLPVVVLLVVLGIVAVWLILATVIWVNRPPLEDVLPALPLVPDLVRLVRSARADPATPGRSRLALGALLLYLRSPVDLLPDLLPGIGTVDDLIIAGVVLRRFERRVGTDAIRAHWPGSDADYDVVRRVTRL